MNHLADAAPIEAGEIESRVDRLFRRLTLREKASLLSGLDEWHTVPIERTGIPSLVLTDGPHGVRTPESGDNRINGPATCFPTGIGMASTWNTELIERVGAALGQETRALGCQVLLGPTINIIRTPLAGRNFETYSEDPYLAGRIGVAYTKGVQSQQIGASVKHFACNNQEWERFRGSSQVDERTLREIYLPAFEAVVKEARPWTVMCSYNRINGVYACENRSFLHDILKGEWGFQGAVVSDWGANHSTANSINGGLDLEMPGPAKYYGEFLVDAYQNWQVSEATIDDAARRILRLVVLSGLLDDPQKLPTGSVNTQEHQDLARQAAEESIVLLKNEGGLLPLDINQVSTLAVIGPNAAEARIGGGGSSFLTPPYAVSPYDGLKWKLGDTVKIGYEPGCGNSPWMMADEQETQRLIDQAVELARNSDIAVVFAGMPTGFESEAYDRPNMDLPGAQTRLIEAVVQANPRTIVVLNVGAPVSMPWIEQVPALLEAFYPGQEGGNAIANLLFGDVNPSGKLTVTFPRRLEDNPTFIYYPGEQEVHYGEEIFVGYRYYDKKDIRPLFPFGFGLSYTTFAYDNLQVPASFSTGETVGVSVRVTNTGSRAGKEVVQLYVSDLKSSLMRPPKELKGFAKVELQPGETKEVYFSLNDRAFAFYDPSEHRWVMEPGEFEILAGSSSRDIRARGKVSLK